MWTWILIVIAIFLLTLSMPISFTIFIISIVYLLFKGGIMVAGMRIPAGLNSFIIIAIPFFMLTGNLMNAAGVTNRIFRFTKTLIGHIPGGLGHVNVLSSLLFAGMSGSAHADAGGLGVVEIKAMREDGYDDGFTGALTSASSIVGPIMPPSIDMVIYGAIANVSVGKLFLGGIIPAILCSASLILTVFFVSKKRQYKLHPKATVKDIIFAFNNAFPALLVPVTIIGGIFSGIFSPTEASAIAILYTLILGIFVYKSLDFKIICKVILDTIQNIAVIGILLAGISMLGYIITVEQIPQQLSQFCLTYISNPIYFLLIVNIFFLFLGMFLETMAIMLLLVPVLVPTAAAMGIDLVHFGILIILNMGIGILTPPMGVSLFVVAKVGNIPFDVLAKAIWMFILPLFCILMLLTFFPQLTLFIPSLMK